MEGGKSASMKEELSRMSSLFTANEELSNLLGESTEKEKLMKIMMVIKYLSTLKICREDSQPIEVIDGLCIGSIGAASNKEGLLKHKITHIVVAASGLKENFPNDFKYIKFNLFDSEEQNIKRHFNEAGEFINEALSKGGRVLVHCHAGISRSSSKVLGYLIKYKRMRLESALTLVKSKRSKINLNNGFMKQLIEYEKECLNRSILCDSMN